MKRLLFFLSIILHINFLPAQIYRINGKVTDNENSNPLANVNLLIRELNQGTVTDSAGNFSISQIPRGQYTLVASYVGFQSHIKNITINSDKELNLELEKSSLWMKEVLITSTKFLRRATDSPLPVEVITKKTIDNSSAPNVSEIMAGSPGISITRDGAWGSDVKIRGLGGSSIVTLIDGNRVETSTALAARLSMIDLSDVENIEVIKGGASSLYGSGAFGGVVNITTKSPNFTDELKTGGTLSSDYNSVNKGRAAHLGLNLSSGKWLFKLNASSRSGKDVETPAGMLANSQFNDRSISAMAAFRPAPDHILKIEFQNFRATDTGIPGGSPFAPGATAKYPLQERTLYSFNYNIFNISNVLKNLEIKYFYQELIRDVEMIPNSALVVTPGAVHKTNGILFNTEWKFSPRYEMVAGIDVWQREYKGHREKLFVNAGKIIGEKPLPDSKYLSAGIFSQNEFKLQKDKWTLNFGGRLDLINISNDRANNIEYVIMNGVKNETPDGQIILWDKNDENEYSWSLNLGTLYKLFPDAGITFNYSRSFRSPSLEERFQFLSLAGITYKGDPALKSELCDSFDAGIRIQSNSISVNANVFYNHFSNLVIDEQVTENLYVKNNVGKAAYYGYEISTDYSLLPALSVYGSLSYIRGEDIQLKTNLPAVPPLNGKLGLTYDCINLFTLDFSGTVFSSQNNVASNELRTGGYTLFDVSARTKSISAGPVNFKLVVKVENLTDKLYRHHLSTYRGIVKFEPGRNYFVKLLINW